jgi:predicted HTH transcriptional regulator
MGFLFYTVQSGGKMDESVIKDLLRMKGKFLYHRENQELEFKEQFNLAGLGNYFCDFAAFSNNRGGYLIFGVKDAPRVPIGLNPSSLEQFEKIDAEKISGFLLDIFSSDIRWEQQTVTINKKVFGIR